MISKQKIVLLTVIAAAVLASTAIAFYVKMSGRPDPSKMTNDQIAGFVKSQDFNSMPREQRHEFFEQVMDSRVNEYFRLPAQDRTKYLDRIIDQMQNMRRNMSPRPMDPNRRDPNQWRQRTRNSSPEQRRARREMRDPQQSAMRQEFMRSMMNRMQQRGIRGPGGGRGPGGTGGPRF